MTAQNEDEKDGADSAGNSFFGKLNWSYILFPNLMPYLTIEDCFRLRSTCTLAHQFVEEYFESNKVLDLSNRRNLSVEAFTVIQECNDRQITNKQTYKWSNRETLDRKTDRENNR
jgi:hypothetical protein